MDCELCKLTARRFKKMKLDFKIEYIDRDYHSLAEYSYHFGRNLEPEMPAILYKNYLYSRKEIFEEMKKRKKYTKEGKE